MTDATRRPVPSDLFGGRLQDCFLLDLEVMAVVDHSPRLRTITFGSTDLIDFTWQPGQDLMLQVPDGDREVRRRYTIRRADPVAGTLDVDAVVHGGGPFGRWAGAADVGDRIDGIGPRGAITLRAGATHHVFVGDESSMAFAFAMVEALPADARATLLLAHDGDEAPRLAPATSATVDLTWLSEDEVLDRLTELTLPADTAAYINGERTLVKQATNSLVERGIPAEAIAAKPYWRRDQANAPHGEPARD